MKADAVNTPSAAVFDAPLNNASGAENMASDFLMALMGVLLQQGGAENKDAGGFLSQAEGFIEGSPSGGAAVWASLYPQGALPVADGKQAGPEESNTLDNNLTNLLFPGAEPVNNGGDLQQTAQTITLGLPLAEQAATSGSAMAVQVTRGPQLFSGGQTGLNVQTQADKPSLHAVNAEQPAETFKNAAVQAEVAADKGTPKGDTVIVVQAQSRPIADSPHVRSHSGVEADSNPEDGETAARGKEMPAGGLKHAEKNFLGQHDNGGRDTAAASPEVRPNMKVAGSGRMEGESKAGDTVSTVHDSGEEIQRTAGSSGSEGKDFSDAKSAAYGQPSEVHAGGTTHIGNVSGRKLAAEMMPYILQLAKNPGGESNRVTVIRLKLEPENLGEIKIRLSFAKGELTAQFFTASGLVKDAVEGSLPQLRETLGQYNIDLGEATAFVGQDQQNGTRFGGYGRGASQGQQNVHYGDRQSVETVSPGQGNSAVDMLI
jgi:flagellar hook-length control protein FliK